MDDRRDGRCGAGQRGSALLAVLGTVAVLAASGFSMAAAARHALDRVSVRSDLSRTYFLARGGMEAALHEMSVQAGARQPLSGGSRSRVYALGEGTVEVISASESGRLDVNRASREALQALLESIGVRAGRAGVLAWRIAAYRSGLRSGWPRRFAPAPQPAADRRPLSSFERRRASIQMVEELLSVPGFSPELLYGRYEPRPDGRAGLRRKSGLLGLLRTSGPAAVDANAAPREVLLAAGLESSLADRLIEERSERPLRPGSPLLELAARQAARVALAASEDATAWALTATARLEDDRAVRAVAATAAYDVDRGGFHIRRWHERAH